MPQNVEPPYGLPIDDLAQEFFGDGRCSGGGRLGDIFSDFMHRHGNKLWTDHLLYAARDFVFDEFLPKPGVVPAQIYESEKDRGEMFLTELRQGAATGLVFDAEVILDGGHPASLDLSHVMVTAQKDIDAGRRDGWQRGERMEVRHQACLRGGYIFMPETDTRGHVIHFSDDTWPIAFKTAWEFLENVGRFQGLLGLVAITMGKRVPRAGSGERCELSSDIWDDGLMRLDLGHNLLFVPTHDDAKPWVARFEDIRLLNLARYPELDPGQETMDWSGQPGRGEKVVLSASAENAVRWGDLGPQIIEEYKKILREDNPPNTYVSCAILIAKRIHYKGNPKNIQRRLRQFRKDGLIENIK